MREPTIPDEEDGPVERSDIDNAKTGEPLEAKSLSFTERAKGSGPSSSTTWGTPFSL